MAAGKSRSSPFGKLRVRMTRPFEMAQLREIGEQVAGQE